MLTIVTDVHLKEGAEDQWDSIMRERLSAAATQPGWIGGQMLQPTDRPSDRIIVGTWHSRDDWEKWHHDARFEETREELEGLTVEPPMHSWNEVVVDARAEGQHAAKGRRSTSRRKRE